MAVKKEVVKEKVEEVKADVKAAEATVKKTAKKAATAAKKTVKKAADKAEAVKKTAAAKKPAAKKAAPAKKDAVVVEFADKQIALDDLVAAAKADFKANNKGAVKSVKIYVKSAEAKVYYVVNDISGEVEL